MKLRPRDFEAGQAALPRSQHFTLTVEKPARQLLARQGYDPQFGARPLKRTIQELLLDPLAQRILSGAYKPGDNIRVTAQADEIIFEK